MRFIDRRDDSPVRRRRPPAAPEKSCQAGRWHLGRSGRWQRRPASP